MALPNRYNGFGGFVRRLQVFLSGAVSTCGQQARSGAVHGRALVVVGDGSLIIISHRIRGESLAWFLFLELVCPFALNAFLGYMQE
jgi:hypothetical protein